MQNGAMIGDESEDHEAAARTVVGQLDAAEQRQLVAQLVEIWKHAPPKTPKAIGGSFMRVSVTSCGERGWWGTGKRYAYLPRHPDGYPWPSIPESWIELWRRFSGRPDLRPDTALCNRYEPADPKRDKPGGALGWHVDQTEQDMVLPIVTISLGAPAQWAVREHEKAPVSRCRLESGSVVLLDVPTGTRLLEHSIERLLAPNDQLALGCAPPAPFFVPMPSPLKSGRISITLRIAGDPRAAALPVERPPAARELSKERMDEILAEMPIGRAS